LENSITEFAATEIKINGKHKDLHETFHIHKKKRERHTERNKSRKREGTTYIAGLKSIFLHPLVDEASVTDEALLSLAFTRFVSK
jgi:hypothetical protein